MKIVLHLFSAFTLLFLLSACDQGGTAQDRADKKTSESNAVIDRAINVEGRDITAEVEAYYDEHPDFFIRSTPDQLPADLAWTNGAGQEELGSPEAKKGGTFNFYMNDFPKTLRFVGPDASGGFRQYILDSNALGLLGFHPDTFAAFPSIAQEWALGDDRKTVYFKINPAARYNDGVAITADDFFFLFYFMRHPALQAPWYVDYYTKKYEKITKYDDHTIAVTFSEAKPDIFYRTALRPVPFHFYRNGFGDDYLERYNFVVEPTAGPYELLPENVRKPRAVTLTKVKDWWANDMEHYRYRYNVDKVRLQVIRDPDKVFEVFKRGEIDVQGLSLPEYWYKKLPDTDELVQDGYVEKITFYNDIPGPDWSLRLNMSRAPLDNKDVRLGLQHACNWQLVLDQVFYGDFERMETSTDGYGELSHPTLKARRFDPVKAAEYFAKAGYVERGPDGILVNANGDRLQFAITTGYKRLENVLTVLKQEAKKAGVDFTLEILEQTSAWKKADQKNHQINFAATNRSPEMYPRFWEMFHSYNAYKDPYDNKQPKPDTNNDTMISIKALDDLIEPYRASPDLGEMTGLSHQIIQMVHDEAAYVPGWKKPWYRVGKWRWMKYPEQFDYRTSRDFYEMHAFWIDEKLKDETEAAKKKGETFPPVIVEKTKYKK